jgi:hypothetical protein
MRCLVLLLAIAMTRCRQSYNPPAIKAANNYLVVDGYINVGANTVTTFNINRTRNLGDTITTGVPELNARVSIVGTNRITYPLTDTANTGVYSSTALNLDPTQQYSIAITTADARQYASDPVPCLATPPMDSIYWRQPNNFTVYASTHDPTNTTHYYRYDYLETWEHDANLLSPWGVVNGMLVATDSTQQKTKCWTTAPSTDVLVASSAAYTLDAIYDFPVTTIPQGDPKIDIGYSILVRQYALTQDAYNYWLLIQKTSQGLGTLFDLQPTQLVGNIHCLTNPSEPVIGFLSACTRQQQRIFVYETYLSNWIHNSPGFGCDTIEIGYDALDFPEYSFADTGYAPYYFNGPTILVLAPTFCLDCTRFGGTTTKPSFWQ